MRDYLFLQIKKIGEFYSDCAMRCAGEDVYKRQIPARWYIQAVRKLMIEGVSVVLVFKEIGILLLMATVLITVSIKKFKYRLE